MYSLQFFFGNFRFLKFPPTDFKPPTRNLDFQPRIVGAFGFQLNMHLQSILPLTLAGCGQLLTGLYLDYLQYSMFFVRISPAMILVTPLLNLKGNLEMNFASRIATYCHIGMVRSNRDLMQLGCINHGLSQSQTITASFVIAVVCIVIKYPVWFIFEY